MQGRVDHLDLDSGACESSPAAERLANSGKPGETAPVVEPKQSRAILLWCCVLIAVLGVLWLQMRTAIPSYNFLIESNRTGLGAHVSIDGRDAGLIGDLSQQSVHLVGLRVSLAEGLHDIVVTKPGFETFKTQLQLSSAGYLNLQLSPQNSVPSAVSEPDSNKPAE